MKKILLILIIFILSNIVVHFYLHTFFGDIIYKWYYIIPISLLSIIITYWYASVFILNRIIRFISYVLLILLIYINEFSFIEKWYIIVPLLFVVLYFELNSIKKRSREYALIEKFKLIESGETLPNEYFYFFQVWFGLDVLVFFKFSSVLKSNIKLTKKELLSIIKKTKKNELIEAIKNSTNKKERSFVYKYNFLGVELSFLYETLDTPQVVERDLKKIEE